MPNDKLNEHLERIRAALDTVLHRCGECDAPRDLDDSVIDCMERLIRAQARVIEAYQKHEETWKAKFSVQDHKDSRLEIDESESALAKLLESEWS